MKSRQAKPPQFSFDEEKVTLVLMWMEEGNSLRTSCEESDVAPSTFMRWVGEDAELAEHYARARERLLDMKAEELEDIGNLAAAATDSVTVAGLRLQSDNRKWLLSKLVPKKYGDRVTQELVGANGGPIETRELSDAERAVRLANLLAAATKRGAKE